jgi:hypothetical protein
MSKKRLSDVVASLMDGQYGTRYTTNIGGVKELPCELKDELRRVMKQYSVASKEYWVLWFVLRHHRLPLYSDLVVVWQARLQCQDLLNAPSFNPASLVLSAAFPSVCTRYLASVGCKKSNYDKLRNLRYRGFL